MKSNKILMLIAALADVVCGVVLADNLQTVSRRKHNENCKCSPRDVCWPSTNKWSALNETLSGKLLAITQPIAAPCYPGEVEDLTVCSSITEQWGNISFQASQPLGLNYPTNITCPPVNYTAGEVPNTCSLGLSPAYVVNATSPEDVAAAVLFAGEHNIRVVIRTTGHDLLGRSEGAASLMIWLRYMRNGLNFETQFKSRTGCNKSNWTGSAFEIGGGHTWSDVYPLAEANNVVVVGGGTPSVSCIGGWMQGGGHGPASRQFGLGADQVLEAQVVLANGTIVTASACENSDLFFAIRGGGPGTYGVVVSTTVKAWPMVHDVVVQHLAIAPLSSDEMPALLDAVSIMFASFPDLNDAGFAGYGSWSIDAPSPLFANFSAGYVHGIYMFDSDSVKTRAAFDFVRAQLELYSATDRLNVSETYVSYPDYWTFFHDESGVEPPVGSTFAGGSRLFDRASVQSNRTSLRRMVEVLAGKPGEYTFNSIELVSGGQVFVDASDTYSGVLPAWRSCYFNNIVSRGWEVGANSTVQEAVLKDILEVKVAAMKHLAPDTGVYMNEGDRRDPEYGESFYGSNYGKLRATKAKYDPDSVFYCPTCVGSSEWEVRDDGKLCQAPKR